MKLGQLALLIAIAIPVVGAAADTKKPVAKWTCADFLGVEDAFRPKLIYWATAQAKADKPEVAMINIEGTEKEETFDHRRGLQEGPPGLVLAEA